ncbi:hypothetical protein CDAR_384911 [Caerostris darwini]|uniref:Uncharacterized protein n=1 Tax=Caerostris darwini TaxID=1538125 RepID=A0AAV4WB31_9ARAC|nr:hypothetical protein CDAR_384911 [Caerostris darwini]
MSRYFFAHLLHYCIPGRMKKVPQICQKETFYDILFSSNEEERSFIKDGPKAFIYLDSEMKRRGSGWLNSSLLWVGIAFEFDLGLERRFIDDFRNTLLFLTSRRRILFYEREESIGRLITES